MSLSQAYLLKKGPNKKLNRKTSPRISPLERSEKDLVLPKRNSGGETREAKLGKQNSGAEKFVFLAKRIVTFSNSSSLLLAIFQ